MCGTKIIHLLYHYAFCIQFMQHRIIFYITLTTLLYTYTTCQILIFVFLENKYAGFIVIQKIRMINSNKIK